MPNPAEEILEDETITEGLPDDEAGILLGWLISLAEEIEGEDPAYLTQLKRLGRQLARISGLWGVPVGDLIDLVELAWEEPGETQARPPRPMKA
ncbi:hypothetical protein [Oceanithermus sp.]